ncbi:MAG TPA: hypothetical protein VJM50_00305, partial [Pyrinomonadaceae bacterium]|nr:hypothetical protein [Pyrinomonadaceae bacterium]
SFVELCRDLLSGDLMPHNQNLKSLRLSRNVTVREVELQSRKIADAERDKRFYISNARLTQLENDPSSQPGLWKLFSLSVIYGVRVTELMRLYNVDPDEVDKYSEIATPRGTCLLSSIPDAYRTREFLKSLIKDLNKTTLLPRAPQAPDVVAPDDASSYGYIGLDDFTMYPLIRPGSFVSLDTTQTKPRPSVWRTEYDRPIYFVEHRHGYVCGWCELQGKHLLLIPHHSSRVCIQRFMHPREAEIVGRVIKFSTSCVDDDLLTRNSHVARAN